MTLQKLLSILFHDLEIITLFRPPACRIEDHGRDALLLQFTTDFSQHGTQDHTLLVTPAAGCVSCHSATVDYVNFVDVANNLKHDDCATCHNATTNAAAQPAGDCSQCHTANYFSSHNHIHDVMQWVADGGGIYCYYGTLSVTDSTLADNSASDNGGALTDDRSRAGPAPPLQRPT